MFSSTGLGTSSFGATTSTAVQNPMKDIPVSSPPDDSISSLRFSPTNLATHLLVAGSWDNCVRCWEMNHEGKTIPKSMQNVGAPVLEVAWYDDGSKVFIASCDKAARCWDLASNQVIQVAAHEAPIKTCHWIKGAAYSCLMTGSWDKTLKFWDLRTPNPVMTLQLGERCYCADVDYPMAVVGTANRGLIIYQLDNTPREYKRIDSPLKFQHRCVTIFRDKKKAPVGFALGSVEGRVSIQYVTPTSPKDNFTFKCQRSNVQSGGYQDIYAVNDIAFHPVHGTLATVGSDGTYSFWDKDARIKLKPSEPMEQSITRCCFNSTGQVFAYAVSYDWSKGHEYNTNKKNNIFLRSCLEDMKPRSQP